MKLGLEEKRVLWQGKSD